jgi:hypothetical protein
MVYFGWNWAFKFLIIIISTMGGFHKSWAKSVERTQNLGENAKSCVQGANA